MLGMDDTTTSAEADQLAACILATAHRTADHGAWAVANRCPETAGAAMSSTERLRVMAVVGVCATALAVSVVAGLTATFASVNGLWNVSYGSALFALSIALLYRAIDASIERGIWRPAP